MVMPGASWRIILLSFDKMIRTIETFGTSGHLGHHFFDIGCYEKLGLKLSFVMVVTLVTHFFHGSRGNE